MDGRGSASRGQSDVKCGTLVSGRGRSMTMFPSVRGATGRWKVRRRVQVVCNERKPVAVRGIALTDASVATRWVLQ